MPKLLPLQELQNRVWSIGVERHLATDITGVSLPVLDFSPGPPAHPYRVICLLYYAVQDMTNFKAPPRVTRAHARITLDLQNGEVVEAKSLVAEDAPTPFLGSGMSDDLLAVPADERSELFDIFYGLCDEAAQAYAEGSATPEQADHLADLQELFARLAEPPLIPDYEAVGQPFFTWLRQNAKAASPSPN